ncbi:periplakin [Stigmatella sp. ncwal1]|uniref:Periplakin n=1 Tax=Stigmatella ashevillensis TaxID=2995309 RepID=A0ABT5D8B6_9BACT|nr:periplakin [Stigmatella ashevillena]MDC0709806.1 periplakin [Stigmatella ashevillena]
MSEARELSDKLLEVQKELQQVKAELDRQRAQHAREQKALQLALEKTREEAARLRERIAQWEEP